MSDAPKAAQDVAVLAEQAGLGKAFRLAPDIVTACIARGRHPLTRSPESPVATPAPVFDPADFEPAK
jgi:hypothetical protein